MTQNTVQKRKTVFLGKGLDDECLTFKTNINTTKAQKAKLIYLGGAEFIRKIIDTEWEKLIINDNYAQLINNTQNWDEILEKYKTRRIGYKNRAL